MTIDGTLRIADLAIVVATMLGPVLAVQAQKYLERRREVDARQRRIFLALMTTRATTLAKAHVEALNAIPVEFYGRRKPLREIIEAWKEYLNHLNMKGMDPAVWNAKTADLFFALLHKLSGYLGYDFNLVELRQEAYLPQFHVEVESNQLAVLSGAAALLRGEKALPMEVRAWPVDAEALTAQKALQALLLAWLRGEAAPRVRVEEGRTT